MGWKPMVDLPKRRRLCKAFSEVTSLSLSSSSSSINDLTDDLLLDILLRLSPKLLHRCKSVSKRWHSLISSPFFARSFILRSGHITINDNSFMLLFKIEHPFRGIGQVYALPLGTGPASAAAVSFDFIPSLCPNNYYYDLLRDINVPVGFVERVLVDMHFKASYGGLVLLEGIFRDHTYAIPYYRNLSYSRYYVCNPVTKHWLELPSLSTYRGSLGFASYFSQSPGTRIWADVASYSKIINKNPDFNPNLIDFTVVSVNYQKQADVFIIRVFSSADETHTPGCSWTNFIVPCPRGRSRWIDKPDQIKVVFCNGKFHWCGKNCIAVYDPFNNPWELYDVILFPPMDSLYSEVDDDSEIDYSQFSLETYQGHLRLVIPSISPIFLVWELDDYASKPWVKKSDIDFSVIDDNSCLSYGGVVADNIYILNHGKSIRLFDLGNNASRQLVYKSPFPLGCGSSFQLFEPFLSSPWPTAVPMRQLK